MRTKITDTRKTTTVESAIRDNYTQDGKPLEDTEATYNARHIDTRKVFIFFEDGDASDWEKKRIAYGSGYSTKSREVTDRWRPVWVATSWSKRHDQEVWVAESAKLKSVNVRKDGTPGSREHDTYLWSSDERKQHLPPDAARFIEEHAPGVFPFALDKKGADA